MKSHKGMSTQEFDALLELAEDGDVSAQAEVGIALRLGYGVKQNGREAIEWLKKAAENDDAQAMCLVGHMYFIGDCGERDYDKALEWYRRAFSCGLIQVTPFISEVYEAQAREAGDMESAEEHRKIREEWYK